MLEALFQTFSYFSRKKEHGLKTLYVALVILSLHWSLVVYINASFLGEFFSDAKISALFTMGAVLSLVPYLYLPSLLQKFGNYRLAVFFTLLEITALLGMAVTSSFFFAALFFLIHIVSVPLILFCLDIFIERIVGASEQKTGSIRGLYLAILCLASAVAPLITGILIPAGAGGVQQSFQTVYIGSAVLLLPFLFIITLYFKDFQDASYSPLNLKKLIALFLQDKVTRSIFCVQIFLQLFFTWTVIYIPLYLSRVAGFTWTEIGYILFVGLLAYVLFEYPVGIIADKYIGEKEMMAFGFFIIALSVSWFAFLPAGALVLWMIATFLTRTGASLVDSTSESYFFRHTQSGDTDKMSLFRMARPLSSILGTVIGSIGLLYMDFNLMFILLGVLMIPGIFFTLVLKDSK